MLKYYLSFIIFSFFSLYLSATTISGNDLSYANTDIAFFKSSDPITGQEVVLGTTIVGINGDFNLKIDISETACVYACLGVYKVYLFAEPDMEYKVVLPPRQDKEKGDMLNPFFKYVDVHLGITNIAQNDLNTQIRMFCDSFNPFYKKHKIRVFSNEVELGQLDKDIVQLDKPFSKSGNTFFNDYRKYKYGLLRFVAFQHKSKSISDIYFKGQPFLSHNPAYVELFKMVYEGYFSYFGRSEAGKQLAPAIEKSKSYTMVKKVLSQDEVLQPDELLNMVMLKCLHDEFYDDNYLRSGMLAVIDSFLVVADNILEITTASNIRKKVTKLLVGYEPPSFELYDTDSNLISLNSLKGKFVYLNFCSCFSYTCLNEFAMLQNLYKKHGKYLEIITVVIDDNVEVMKDFVERSGYAWTFLHFDNNPDVMQEYDVRVFPTYYLIDNEGKLSMSPAPSPNEEFEGRLFKVLRAKGVL